MATEESLFFFLSDLDEEIKLKIITWYNDLPIEEQKFVDILRNQASDEADYFSEKARSY